MLTSAAMANRRVYAQSMRFVAAFLLLAFVACRQTPKIVPDNPRIIEDVRLQGFEVLPEEAREDLQDHLELRAGEILTDAAEKKDGDRAVEVLQNHGYPYGQIALSREPAGQDRIRLTLIAEPGTRGFFGPIEIAGNRRVDGSIIRRRFAYSPGEVFSRSAIEQTQQRIGALGLFKSVEIRAVDVDQQPAIVPTLVTVTEKTPWQWNLGLGYSAGDRLGVDARISHLNFLGRARRLDVEGRVSAIEKNAGVTFTQNDAWHPALGLSLEARHHEIDERSFFVLSRGGQAAVSWQWTPAFGTTASYAVALERSDVDAALAPLLGLEDGMLSAWSVDFDHRRFSQTAPLQTLTLHIEQAGGWMPGTFNYFSSIADARRYRTVAGGRMTIAGRARYGSIASFGDESDIPLLKRFFLGGSTEMRGWGVYELSPLSASGEPVGGRSFFTATVEGRLHLHPRVTAALFAEAGNAWSTAGVLRLSDLLYDAGPGIRLRTPFGLIRFDFGYQLKTLPGLRLDGAPQQSRWRMNFGIGEAF